MTRIAVTDGDMRSAAPTLRDRFNDLVARHDVAWELGMGALAIVYVALGFIIDDVPPGTRPGLELLELALTATFALEFVSRFWAARDRRRYLRSHWIDLVALIPVARGLRVARLLRLLRLVRTFAGIFRALTHVERLAHHRGLAWLFVAWLAVAFICSMALYAVENGVMRQSRRRWMRFGGAS